MNGRLRDAEGEADESTVGRPRSAYGLPLVEFVYKLQRNCVTKPTFPPDEPAREARTGRCAGSRELVDDSTRGLARASPREVMWRSNIHNLDMDSRCMQ